MHKSPYPDLRRSTSHESARDERGGINRPSSQLLDEQPTTHPGGGGSAFESAGEMWDNPSLAGSSAPNTRMLLQTNSYVVPKDRRPEHARLLRRFRQTLARLGCEHFEVYEQVGANWSSAEPTGRYVQLMR